MKAKHKKKLAGELVKTLQTISRVSKRLAGKLAHIASNDDKPEGKEADNGGPKRDGGDNSSDEGDRKAAD